MKTSEIPLEAIKGIAEQAGAATLDLYRSQEAWVEQKADGSPLTAADMASEKIIRTGLRDVDESIPYLSEESTASTYEERRRWERFWLVDPLDGRKVN